MFNDEQMLKFGWRIPFLFGLVVALFGLWMRKGLEESSIHEHYKKQVKNMKNPLCLILKHSKLTVLFIILHTALGIYYSV